MGLFDFHFDFGQWSIPFFRRKPKTVLVVEDDFATIALIRHTAESIGYLLESATTAEEALGILHSNGKRFVVVLIDVNLPSMDGWSLRKLLHESWPSLHVVVMSGTSDSFIEMPSGELLSVMIKPNNYGDFFRTLK